MGGGPGPYPAGFLDGGGFGRGARGELGGEPDGDGAAPSHPAAERRAADGGECGWCCAGHALGGVDGGGRLRRCGGCGGVRYCSAPHQRLAWTRHKNACATLKAVAENVARASIDPGDVAAFRRALLRAVDDAEAAAGAALHPRERFAALTPRVCAWCFAPDTHGRFGTCGACRVAAFCCAEHEALAMTAPGGHTEVACYLNAMAAAADRVAADAAESRASPAVWLPKSPIGRYAPLPSEAAWTRWLDERGCPDGVGDALTPMYTVALSYPLTMVYALQLLAEAGALPGDDLPSRRRLAVHVVGAVPQAECFVMKKWEEVLHQFPEAMALELVFTGPELPPGLPAMCGGEPSGGLMCELCAGYGRSLDVRFHAGPYSEFAAGEEYEAPDAAVCFNAAFARDEAAWQDSLMALLGAGVPVVHTAETLEGASADAAAAAALGAVAVLAPRVNPYRSMRWRRDAEHPSDMFAVASLNFALAAFTV